MKRMILSLVVLFSLNAEIAFAADPTSSETDGVNEVERIERQLYDTRMKFLNDSSRLISNALSDMKSLKTDAERSEVLGSSTDKIVEISASTYIVTLNLLTSNKSLIFSDQTILFYDKFLGELRGLNNELLDVGYVFIPFEFSRVGGDAIVVNNKDKSKALLHPGGITGALLSASQTAKKYCHSLKYSEFSEPRVIDKVAFYSCGLGGLIVHIGALIPAVVIAGVEGAAGVMPVGSIVTKASPESEQFRIN